MGGTATAKAPHFESVVRFTKTFLSGPLRPEGVLRVDGQRFSLTHNNGEIEFETTLDQCKISIPWWYFGCAMRVRTTDGTKYYIGLYSSGYGVSTAATYGGTGLDSGSAGSGALGAVGLFAGLHLLRNARSASRRWKQVLSQAGAL